MWKLFATMVAMSDTGSITMTQIATDFVTRQACEQVAHDLFPESFERDLNGHHLALRSSAECRLDGEMIPPPLVRLQREPQQPIFGYPYPMLRDK